MKGTFLYRVLKHDGNLFDGMLVFILGTLACNFAGVEITPFFVWGMYSEKEPPARHYELLQTTVNDSLLLDVNDLWANDTRFYLTSPVAYYRSVRDNKDIDPIMPFIQDKLPGNFPPSLEAKLFNTDIDRNAFMGWYARYLQTVLGKQVGTLQLDVVRVHYEGPRLVRDTVYTVEKWSKP